MGEYVENKDRAAVNKLYDEVQREEFVMCHLLNAHMPEKMKYDGYFFEMQSKGNKYTPHDLEFVQISIERERKLIARVEFEFGKEQFDWDYKMPRKRWKGINLMTRKDYGFNFDLFIKVSPTYHSFFAIDCSDGYIDRYFLTTIDNNPSSLEFITNERKFEIPWNMVNEHKFEIDNENKKIINKNFCLVEFDEESDDWGLFYKFLWRRFLDGSERDKK